MSLWKFDYEFDRERLLQEAKTVSNWPEGAGLLGEITTNMTYYSKANGEAELVYKEDIQDYLDKEPFHRKLAREKLNMLIRVKSADTPYAQEIWKYFENLTGMLCQPKFFIYLKGLKLPWHKDVKTECSINLILTDSPDPVRFKGKEEIYTIGLLNTQTLHSVHTTKDRYLYRIQFQENTWQEVKNALEVRL